MGWLAKWWDELTGGPEIRAAKADGDALRQAIGKIEKVRAEEHADLLQRLQQVNERARLLDQFVHSGGIKTRCVGGCGDLTFDFMLHHTRTETGGVVLVPICDGCKRRRAQEQARRDEALKAGAALSALAQPAEAAAG